MNILLITNVWTGAQPFFFEGKEESKGMPAFNNVFYRLINDKRVSKIHIIVWLENKTDKIQIPVKYQDKITTYPFCVGDFSLLKKFLLILKIIKKGIQVVKNQKIKEIIGFGSLASISAIIGRFTKIPDFRRVYGSFLINEIDLPKYRIFFRHPLEYLCFSLKGKGLLITNDGTKGDLVYKKLGNPKLPFYFPINGIDKQIAESIKKPDIELPNDFICYVARLDSWKRQHLLIEALGFLKNNGINFPKAYIIGSVFDKNYSELLTQTVAKYSLENKVEIIYGLPIKEVHYMLKKAIITFSLYHTSNLGNVFIEALQLGTPIIAINDTGSLDLIDKKAFYELKNDAVQGVAEAIKLLLNDEILCNKISEEAIIFSNHFIKSWDERANYEINLFLD